jgi:hypothetical protein
LIFQGTVDIKANVDVDLIGSVDFRWQKRMSILPKQPITPLGWILRIGSIQIALGANVQIDAMFTAVSCINLLESLWNVKTLLANEYRKWIMLAIVCSLRT